MDKRKVGTKTSVEERGGKGNIIELRLVVVKDGLSYGTSTRPGQT